MPTKQRQQSLIFAMCLTLGNMMTAARALQSLKVIVSGEVAVKIFKDSNGKDEDEGDRLSQ